MITGRAKLAGVLGWPVSHSRSPRLHNAWIARHDLDAAYLPLAVPPDRLAAAIAGLRACGFTGANVTIPHKQEVAGLCTELAPSARKAGAVNTLVFNEAGIIGSNTDGAGFIANLRSHGINPSAGPALILGAGGAARGIAAALQDEGAPITITNRTHARAETLASMLGGANILDWRHAETALTDHALLVNTTSLGMAGEPPLGLSLDRAPNTLAVADIVYVPLHTKLIQDARARCLRTAPGLGMLLHQAVPGFAAWFGITPVVDSAIAQLVAQDIPPE